MIKVCKEKIPALKKQAKMHQKLYYIMRLCFEDEVSSSGSLSHGIPRSLVVGLFVRKGLSFLHGLLPGMLILATKQDQSNPVLAT
jgi:hypothetical protein